MKVTIVGAGVVGYAIAYELAARGADVRSSIRAAAGRAPRGRRPASSRRISKDIRRSFCGSALCSLDQYDDFITRVSADAQRSIEYRRTGTLQVARTDDEARMLEQARTCAGAARALAHLR